MTQAGVVRARMPAEVMVTLVAVLVSGFIAAHFVSPTLYVATMLVVLLVWSGTRDVAAPVAPGDDFAFLPAPLDGRVSEALGRVGDGDARRLLVAVIAQARPLFTRGRQQLDDRAEAETRENVSSLVDACCATAESLAELDRAVGAARTNPDASARAAPMRQRLVDHLTGAASTLRDLYLAGLEQETDALSRISQLTATLHEDASARQAAAQELQRLLSR